METQKVFELYNILDSRYNMEGSFLGKSIVGIEYCMKMLNLHEDFFIFYIDVIKLVDRINMKEQQKNIDTKE